MLAGGIPERPEERKLEVISLNLYADRTVIRARHLTPDKRSLEPGSQSGRKQEIINAPSDVLSACSGQRTPPGVIAAAFFKFPKRIYESCLDKRHEPRPLFLRKTVSPNVALWIGEVQFGMRHIEVAAENNRLFRFQFLQVAQKRIRPIFAGKAAE